MQSCTTQALLEVVHVKVLLEKELIGIFVWQV